MNEMTVIGDRIAVDVTPPTHSQGGLILPEFAKNEAENGVILNCGPDVHSSALVPGAHVVFGRFAGTVFKLDAKHLKIVREEDIMLVLNTENQTKETARWKTA